MLKSNHRGNLLHGLFNTQHTRSRCSGGTASAMFACLHTQPKPEVGIQFGAGGTSTVGSLAAEGTRDVKQLVSACRTFKEHVSWQGGAGGGRGGVQVVGPLDE